MRENSSSFLGCFARLAWMAGGNLALALLAVLILFEARWNLTVKDVAFWALVVALIALRYFDVTQLGGRTAQGAPATPRHVRLYAGWLVAVAACGWTLAQSVHLR